MGEFKNKTVRSILWSVVSQVGRQMLLLIIGIILARLLSPEEFGLIAMVTVITSFALIFGELGFSAALVQKKDITQDILSSIFWLNLCAGILLTVVFIICAPLIARFYQEPVLIPLTILVSLNFTLSSLNIVQNTILTKSLDFRTISIVEIISVSISGLIAIVLAYMGFGVWSLAIQTVTISAITAILLWLLNDWRPKFVFKWSGVKDLLGFSSNLLGTNTLNYWARNIDYILIGRYLGSYPLGIYNRAYMVMLFPLQNVTRVIARVMFPSFSLIQDDKERIKKLHLRLTRIVALFTFPMMLGIFVTVEAFVLTIFGEKWVAMIPVLRILSLVGLVQSIIGLNGYIYLSQGKADLQFRLGLVFKSVVILGILIGLRWNIIGVAIGYAFAMLINLYPNVYFSGRLINLSFWELMVNLSGVYICAFIMAIIVAICGLFLPSSLSSWLVLMIQVSLGGCVYIFILHLFKIKAYQDIQELLIEQIQLFIKGRNLNRIRNN